MSFLVYTLLRVGRGTLTVGVWSLNWGVLWVQNITHCPQTNVNSPETPNFRISYFRPLKCRPLHSAARGACLPSPPFPPPLASVTQPADSDHAECLWSQSAANVLMGPLSCKHPFYMTKHIIVCLTDFEAATSTLGLHANWQETKCWTFSWSNLDVQSHSGTSSQVYIHRLRHRFWRYSIAEIYRRLGLQNSIMWQL